ncbi:MAG: KH domain-containing protein [Elusimicrobia bacterium]|nr:KH domain-containing protein [Elusimicrobiota bacterium]
MAAKDLVLFVVKRLAGQPDRVELKESEQDGVLQLQLVVAEEDKGKIIGKQGKVIKAIRAIAAAAESKPGRKVSVDID